MKLVFGSSGQVASALKLMPDVVALGRKDCDLTKRQNFHEIIKHFGPSAVVNAAAYTHVDDAEFDDKAFQLNSVVPKEIASACKKLGVPFIHLSTDYVFSGEGTLPWKPEHRAFPINRYGKSKLDGEQGVSSCCDSYVILRTSWTFSSSRSNFVTAIASMADGAESREFIEVVEDQVGGPTPAESIAEACIVISDELTRAPWKSGIYHLSGWPDVSRAELASAILTELGSSVEIRKVRSSSLTGTHAKRPLNSRLDCESLHRSFGIQRPRWRATLKHVFSK
tara:strand:+ start:248 stop:1090 length:843 start_codon:yes stop_codon:yes gene_type:complete